MRPKTTTIELQVQTTLELY